MSRLNGLIFIILLFAVLPASVSAGVSTSQSVGYTVIGPPDGVNTTQSTGYTVIGPPDGVNTTQSTGYTVIGPPDGVNTTQSTGYTVIGPPDGINVTQTTVYVVIGPPTAKPQPSIFIITKNDEAYEFPAEVSLSMLLSNTRYYLKTWPNISVED